MAAGDQDFLGYKLNRLEYYKNDVSGLYDLAKMSPTWQNLKITLSLKEFLTTRPLFFCPIILVV